MPNHNLGRLTEDIKREISAAIPQLTDKRISEGFVTVTHVDLTSDLSYCKVMVSVMGGEEKTDEVISVLQKAEGFFKRRINARIKMRKMPEIIFIADKIDPGRGYNIDDQLAIAKRSLKEGAIDVKSNQQKFLKGEKV